MRCLHLPDWRKSNPYQQLLVDSLQRAGVSTAFANYPPGLFSVTRAAWRAGRPDVVHMHWADPIVLATIWSRSRAVFQIKKWLLAADLCAVRLSGVRIVWTVHNLVSHESPDPARELAVNKLLAKQADPLIVHSEGAARRVRDAFGLTRRDAVRVIPHGHYVDSYAFTPGAAAALRRDLGLAGSERVVLFFGAIRRYKGIERLLRCFSQAVGPDLRLVVAGAAHDAGTAALIQSAAAADSRLCARIELVPADQVATYFEICDVFCASFESSLTSGSAVLAMSLGKALMLPAPAMAMGLVGSEGAHYFHDDAALTRTFERLDKADLALKGAHNLQQAVRNDWAAIGLATRSAYEEPC